MATITLLCAYLVDINQRAYLLQEFVRDNERSVGLIVSQYAPPVLACRSFHSRSDVDSLAAAFIAVESFATPTLDAWARNRLTAAAVALNITVPDITIGPGRIRPRTARQALQADENQDSEHIADKTLVAEILSPCGSMRVAKSILREIMQQDRLSNGKIDYRFVQLSARIYNGEALKAPSIEARISASVYFNLVYHTFQYYRFIALSAAMH
jgi:hypothetical protein